ncbi:DASS family sodium-coupled anion symporter [Pseudodesulfovibrio cashew]|uniref:DASS family sodium-coupled anion symporter n=1 Tax=Pseudodesulfovibrio cashew TaxID=2678688 RepID=A0A6I6JPN6_9BACT|nr:DASS family sodium-coupled anion symporter [Pseudodesulfovibrio cashew]QGY39594.1 DASS family sodium-coupled anion symporter [Pseudodesulfovibrio cashew]
MIHYLREKRWFFITLVIQAAMLLGPVPEGVTPEGWKVLVMTVGATLLFVTEPIPLPAVALLIILGQVFLLGMDSSLVAKSLMKDSVLFIMGSLMLAVALVKQKLDKRLALVIVSITGSNTYNIAFGISIFSGILASFIGEHTVAAMMLPVALSLLQLATDDERQRRALAILFLFSISYACAMAGIGTPSGGARNAIMIDYLRDFFYSGTDPATDRYRVSYLRWMIYAYPVFLIQLPLMHFILRRTCGVDVRDMSVAVAKLREQVGEEGALQGRHYVAIALFLGILVGWVGFSSKVGMGTIAILGAVLFLVAGLVRWQDLNSGVNWGVVWLYAAAISLGVQMRDTGAAAWAAGLFMDTLAPVGLGSGLGLLASVMFLTTFITNTMSNGAAVAVLGPIVLSMAVESGTNPLAVGMVTAVSSAFAYFTVIGTPASTIVYSSGYLLPPDFMRVGWRMAIMSFAVLILASKLYWPLVGM